MSLIGWLLSTKIYGTNLNIYSTCIYANIQAPAISSMHNLFFISFESDLAIILRYFKDTEGRPERSSDN